MSKDATMTGHATITFSQGGVQPPVYLVTSLSGWTLLEMDLEKDKTETGDLIFSKRFPDVVEGRYQYKIRVGDNHWLVDESRESDMDEHGNRNNVVYVTSNPALATMSPNAPELETPKDSVEQDRFHKTNGDRKDSTVDAHDVPVVLTSLATAQSPADIEQPSRDSSLSQDSPHDATEHTHNAEVSSAVIETEPGSEHRAIDSPQVPLLVVEGTDNITAARDNFKESTTTTPKVVHGVRAAESSLNSPINVSDHPVVSTTSEGQDVPLFPHETTQVDEPPHATSLGTVQEASSRSSMDQKSVDDAPNSSSGYDADEESNYVGHSTLPPYGTGLGERAHSVVAESQEIDDNVPENEFDQAPLLSHETGFTNGDDTTSDDTDYENEFEKAPLLPHETGFSENIDNDNLESVHGSSYSNEEYPTSGSENDAPLLPHERSSEEPSKAGSDGSEFSFNEQPSFGYETDITQDVFLSRGHASFFKTRTNSSMLPHKMPRTDAEDENLNDPSLERFPTSRDQIFQRVATIGHHLPEDEPHEDHRASPPLSVLSQACSSVDLAPVKSYTSLASVPESEFSDEEEEGDVDSLPSPVLLAGSRSSRSHSGFTRDPHATPMPGESKQLGFIAEDERETRDDKETEGNIEPATASQEAKSLDKDKSAEATQSVPGLLSNIIASPATILKSETAPHTSEDSINAEHTQSTVELTSELRERRTGNESSSGAVSTEASPEEKGEAKAPASLALASQPNTFLAACVGDRKRASTSVAILGVAVAACYYFAWGS